MRGVAAAALALALAIAPGARAADLEFVHWPTIGDDAAAAKVLADAFQTIGHRWVDVPAASAEAGQALILKRLLTGDPPGAAQFEPGALFRTLVAAGLLLDLNPVAEEEGWDRLIRPDAVKTACKIDGHWYCVPAAIRSVNWVWTSAAAFSRAGLLGARTAADLQASASRLLEAGIVPLAVNAAGAKALAHNLLLDALGSPGLERLYRDRDVALAGGAEVLQVMQAMKDLGADVREGSAELTSSDLTAMIADGRAAYHVGADWTGLVLRRAGKSVGADFACNPGPSAFRETLLVSSEIVVFFKQPDPQVERAQLGLASLVVTPEVQEEFSRIKGAEPVRGDVSIAGGDACSAEATRLLAIPGRTAMDPALWRSAEFAAAESAIWADLLYDPATTPHGAQARFVQLLTNIE